VVHARVEAYQAPEKFNQIVSRAFAELDDFVRLSAHLLVPGGHWLAMKGVLPKSEITHLKAARVLRTLPLQVPGLDAERSLIIMEPV